MEESENEAIETMQKLGLTFTEARIYLALVAIFGENNLENFRSSPSSNLSISAIASKIRFN